MNIFNSDCLFTAQVVQINIDADKLHAHNIIKCKFGDSLRATGCSFAPIVSRHAAVRKLRLRTARIEHKVTTHPAAVITTRLSCLSILVYPAHSAPSGYGDKFPPQSHPVSIRRWCASEARPTNSPTTQVTARSAAWGGFASIDRKRYPTAVLENDQQRELQPMGCTNTCNSLEGPRTRVAVTTCIYGLIETSIALLRPVFRPWLS